MPSGRLRGPNAGYSAGCVAPVSAKIVDFVIYLAVILFAISFHESAHAWSAFRFGDSTAKDQGRISLNPLHHIDPFGSVLLPALLYFTSGMLFGYAKPTPVDLRNTRQPRLANLVVSAAGPLSNFLLAALGVVGLLAIQRGTAIVNAPSISRPLWDVALAVVQVNLGLGVFNLLPLPPLDGSGVLASVLGPGAQRFFALLAPFGFLILILLSSMGVLGRILGPVFAAFSTLIQRVLT